jgi:SAM-dependent methyltransferase
MTAHDTELHGYVERIVPDETPPGPLAIHETRYTFALPYCAGKRVLDAACGVGYGTAILAREARECVGLDLSADAIGYARTRYAAPNVEFRVADLSDPGLPPDDFDVVVSFETIEHLPDREPYLRHVAATLRPDGVYLVSTPRVDVTVEPPENPFHHVEYSAADFEALLRRHFGEVELYGQRRPQTTRHRVLQRLDVLGLRRRLGFARALSAAATGTRATEELRPEDLVIDRVDVLRADVLVAVCRQPLRP